MENTNKFRVSTVVAMVVAATLSRFLFLSPSMANFSPIGAMALFGGAYFANKKLAYLVPLLSIWLSSMILNNTVYKQYYPSFSFGFETIVFIGFAVVVTAGVLLLKKINVSNLLLANVVGTLGFFLVSNFGVWANGTMYAHTLEGLTTCYTMALPFLRNSLTSNLLFSAVFFGAFELAKRQAPSLVLE